MLVISRKKNEIVFIGDDIEVMVTEIRGDKVLLGFTAKDSVKIHRKEVYLAIKRNESESK